MTDFIPLTVIDTNKDNESYIAYVNPKHIGVIRGYIVEDIIGTVVLVQGQKILVKESIAQIQMLIDNLKIEKDNERETIRRERRRNAYLGK